VVVLPKLDHFLNLIEDGAWHDLEELSKRSKIPKQKLATLSKLLSETNIVEYETKGNHVRIKPEWQRMFKNIYEEQVLEKAAVGTIVLPPKKSLIIQGVYVTNLTEKELEISMRVNDKIEEFAIGMID
jgi:hypothetical protein